MNKLKRRAVTCAPVVMACRALATVALFFALLAANKLIAPLWAQLLATAVLVGIYTLATSKLSSSASRNDKDS
ncbi:hypothetical protein [Streptomyces sp. CT34]|uniref:hypothetical protein n=1 Tax=Streptomyces sp. CT34 TaxID=1553907 RepID=UPI0012FEAD6D|nr:hypothetical protein [Streptomyces sp. CT34]